MDSKNQKGSGAIKQQHSEMTYNNIEDSKDEIL